MKVGTSELQLGAAGAADNDILYTSDYVDGYNQHVIENASAVAIDVFVSLDGRNFSSAAASTRLLDDVTTGGGVKVISIAANKIGVLDGTFSKIRVMQAAAGTITAGTVKILHVK